MTNRKFFALVVCFLLLFSVLFSSGCGGGGSGSAIDEDIPALENQDNTNQNQGNGNNQTNDTTPQTENEQKPESESNGEKKQNSSQSTSPSPNPSLVNIEASYIDYIVDHISIGYQNGDNSKYVTRNLILPTNFDENDEIEITWSSSNPSIISSTGVVNRPTVDTKVTLTATVSDSKESIERDFTLNVIRQRSRTIEQAKEEIQINGVDEIRLMNTDNEDFQITYSTERDRVTDIDGKYSDIVVTNADDALDSIQSVRGILGINDPYEELENSVITSDTYGAEYTFGQVHDGVRVYGRNITASANETGETDFVASSFLPSTTLENANLNFSYSEEQAENIAKEYYEGDFDVRSDMTDKVIFTLEDYENNPVPAYVVNIYGNDDEGEYLDENLFVNALNGEVIYNFSNICEYSVTAKNEMDELVTFEVEEKVQYGGGIVHAMHDPETNVWILNENYPIDYRVIKPEGSEWTDKQQISAYTNMIEVMKWWKASFDRNSLDDEGGTVDVITHEKILNKKDNAFWSLLSILISDPSTPPDDVIDARGNQRSYAVDIAALVHESTHGVLDYCLDLGYSYGIFPHRDVTGAINEGYADIFGCLKTHQWKNGLNVHADGYYTRNIADPRDPKATQNRFGSILPPTTYSQRYTGYADDGGIHYNSALISYPAYLMYSYGMSWEDLAKIWYKSMRMGYSATSDYFTVRKCVLRAAYKLGMEDDPNNDNDNIDMIKKAFDEVGITETLATFEGNVSEYNGSAIPSANVVITPYNSTAKTYSVQTDSTGNFYCELVSGTYLINVSVSEYVPFEAVVKIEEGADNILNITLVKPTDQIPSTLNGIVKDAVTGDVLGGVNLEIRAGWNIHIGTAITTLTTEADGSYTTSINAGYYTIDAIKTGYIKTPANMLVVPKETEVRQDIIMPPTEDNKYRVTLQWEANPRDLDSHLIGPLTDSNGTFHVYFAKKEANDTMGNNIANLDHDDTQGYGFETIMFEMQPGDKFEYYVHWYAGEGTWTGSNAVVNLYKGSKSIGTFSVPDVNENGYWKYWHVFDLISGMDPIQPAISDAIVQTGPTLD